ncbi:hypothetical protein HHL16_00705 [Pseudoflavitalea sp. G-6-1-2]|uniref:LiaF transmembrane domain-containing protein n=1 Tax=Pseudoflavitalea sp. G-6-1-2 TaxID=2728841 RepID=UPI00146A76A1|nr:hypothetical protein [Pseudoflavitalea sp. G-6-1-2]NML19366.1 hypothetical protein [Pseudoflavitalea sp. G-6-1-2]
MDSYQQDANTSKGNKPRKSHTNKWAGFALLLVGAVLLTRSFGLDLPEWIISWPMAIIAAGIIVGATTKFRDYTWLMMIGAGVFFLIVREFPEIRIQRYILPIIFIGVGIMILYGSRESWFSLRRGNRDENGTPDEGGHTEDQSIDMTSAFGGIKKVIYNKSFKGGEILTIFGGGEVNLLNADFEGTIILEVTVMFGGIKLIVPAHWEVSTTEAVAIFGGIDDKRSYNTPTDPNKKLIVRGTILFGGLDVKNY